MKETGEAESLEEEVTLPINMVSVVSTIRRFHVSVLFYLFDLHVGLVGE